MAKKAYRVHNWKDYNKYLIKRGSLTFWFSEDVAKGWRHTQDTPSRRGQKYYGDIVIHCGRNKRKKYQALLQRDATTLAQEARPSRSIEA